MHTQLPADKEMKGLASICWASAEQEIAGMDSEACRKLP
jgi:hypothetical protein